MKSDFILLIVSLVLCLIAFCCFIHIYKEKKALLEQRERNNKVNADEKLMNVLENQRKGR